jgi:hypothetical protein
MNLLVEVKEEKAEFILELLYYFKFVKTKSLSNYKKEVLEDLSDAVEEMNFIKDGKKKSVPFDEFLNEIKSRVN